MYKREIIDPASRAVIIYLHNFAAEFYKVYLIVRIIRFMKFRFLLSAAVAFVMPLAAEAYETGDVVELTPQLYGKVFSKNGSNHIVEVYANPDNKPSGALEIKNMYTEGGDTFTVTMIATGAFEYSDVTDVTVGAQVYLVGSRAFLGCTKLTSFVESEPGSVTVINDEAFGYTLKLTEARFPGAKLVGEFAFRRSGIASATMPEVKEIKAGAFQECQNLVSLNGGAKVESIGNIAFCNCPKFTGMTLGSVACKGGLHDFRFRCRAEGYGYPRRTDRGRELCISGIGTDARVYPLRQGDGFLRGEHDPAPQDDHRPLLRQQCD